MTDQEGGKVRRLSGGPDVSAKRVGELANLAQAATQARGKTASTLKGSSVNCNLAPVLDIFRQGGDFTDSL